jgi:hypothetical protein
MVGLEEVGGLLELELSLVGLGGGGAGVAVGEELAGQLEVGTFDLVLSGVAGDAEEPPGAPRTATSIRRGRVTNRSLDARKVGCERFRHSSTLPLTWALYVCEQPQL